MPLNLTATETMAFLPKREDTLKVKKKILVMNRNKKQMKLLAPSRLFLAFPS